MRQLLNTLYVLTPEHYLALDGETVIILSEDKEIRRFPLHILQSIYYFGYRGASPALMGACAKRQIALVFMKPNGRFLARVCGMEQGNVLLRKKQMQVSDRPSEGIEIVRNMLLGKVFNSRWVLERATRDHPIQVDVDKIKAISRYLQEIMPQISACADADGLRGIEGKAAERYFSVLDDLIIQNKAAFRFDRRSRRPPEDPVNAMLSFGYSILTNDCASALEAAGLDPYIGFLHTDRPGRMSLALDLMEELRSIAVDRLVLSLINRRQISENDFEFHQSGAVLLNEEGRKKWLNAWQTRKKEEITHPFLGEKLPWGLVPFLQAQLLARHLRGDLDEYPPFFWK